MSRRLDFGSRCDLDLHPIAAAIDGQHRVVRGVGRRTDGVGRDDHPEPEIYGTEDRGENADFRFGARHHERGRVGRLQLREQSSVHPRAIDTLVDDNGVGPNADNLLILITRLCGDPVLPPKIYSIIDAAA
jgi:hypothetical protein